MPFLLANQQHHTLKATAAHSTKHKALFKTSMIHAVNGHMKRHTKQSMTNLPLVDDNKKFQGTIVTLAPRVHKQRI